MFKQISKFYLVAWGCFLAGVMALMLNVISGIFDVIFSVLFLAGLVSICIKKIIDYRVFKEEITLKKESMSIDLSLQNDGSFAMKESNLSKKQLRDFSNQKREKLAPILVFIALILLMGFLTYKLVAGLIN
ncbi:MAG: hypothetical protein IJW82_00190 [Clostridia bacterium]|nr:hypothetical protein [Clostridia bacterium]